MMIRESETRLFNLFYSNVFVSIEHI